MKTRSRKHVKTWILSAGVLMTGCLNDAVTPTSPVDMGSDLEVTVDMGADLNVAADASNNDTGSDLNVSADLLEDPEWPDDGLNRRVRFDIDNMLDDNLENFQVRLLVPETLDRFLPQNARFFSEDGTLLKHEWEVSTGDHVFWVRVDLTKGDNSIWMHFGGSPQTSYDPQAVWNNHDAVFHFPDEEPSFESKSARVPSCQECGTAAGVNAGSALQTEGNTLLTLIDPDIARTGPDDSRTISLWFKKNRGSGGAEVMVAEDGCVGWKIAVNTQIYSSFNTVIVPDSGDEVCEKRYIANIPTAQEDQFHHVLMTIDRENNQFKQWVDGKLIQTFDAISRRDSSTALNIEIGGQTNGSFLKGAIDEVRLRPGVATKSEIQAHYLNLTNPSWARLDGTSFDIK